MRGRRSIGERDGSRPVAAAKSGRRGASRARLPFCFRGAGCAIGGFALIAAASGCAPMLATFLEPRAQGGEITTRRCPPLPDVLLFKREGVVAAVFLGHVVSGRQTIFVSFQVPRGRTVRLLGSGLEVSIAGGERLRRELTGTREGSKGRTTRVEPESLMVGRTERLRYGTQTGYTLTPHELYEFSAEFATPLGDAFTVTLPGVVVNGFSWDLPAVRFKRVRRWVISPFNC